MASKPKITILSVDDDGAVRDVVRWVLDQEGFEVKEATTGMDALRLVAEKPDLVILDVNLPDMSGFEVCRQIKANPATSTIPILHLSGTYLDSQSRVTGLNGGADGYLTQPLEPPVLVATVKALLRMHRAETEVRAIAQQWQATFDAIKDAIAVLDMEGRVLRCNQAFADILQKPMSEIIGRACCELVHGTMDLIKGCPFVRMRESRCREFVELQIGERWLCATADPVLDDAGSLIGAVHIMSDITERKNLENQLRHSQKMEAIGQLSGGIAHDFNNTLTAIMGYTDFLRMKMSKDDPLRVNADQILALSERAANLTQGLITFSRKQIINPRPVRLNDIVGRVARLLARLIGEDIELEVLLTEEDLTIMADSSQMEQVLMNLATNARDAMPGGGMLAIRTAPVQLDIEFIKTCGYGKVGKYALITFTDTGTGIDEESREKIFEPFFTTKEVGKGTGLGLSIVYGIIKRHNGYINVYSKIGKGTTFNIFLPAINSEVEETPSTALPPIIGGPETVLVAEDDAWVRKLIKKVLAGFDYKVIEAIDGKDAIRIFNENKDNIQLLLLDLIMPKMNGKEVYDEIRKVRPDIKAIFTSGYTSNIIDKKGFVEEGLNFISKPVSPKDLLIKVREVLDK